MTIQGGKTFQQKTLQSRKSLSQRKKRKNTSPAIMAWVCSLSSCRSFWRTALKLKDWRRSWIEAARWITWGFLRTWIQRRGGSSLGISLNVFIRKLAELAFLLTSACWSRPFPSRVRTGLLTASSAKSLSPASSVRNAQPRPPHTKARKLSRCSSRKSCTSRCWTNTNCCKSAASFPNQSCSTYSNKSTKNPLVLSTTKSSKPSWLNLGLGISQCMSWCSCWKGLISARMESCLKISLSTTFLSRCDLIIKFILSFIFSQRIFVLSQITCILYKNCTP